MKSISIPSRHENCFGKITVLGMKPPYWWPRLGDLYDAYEIEQEIV